jgi:AraC-like DNA-binding protein
MSQKLIPLALIVSLALLLATWFAFRHRELQVYPCANPQDIGLFSYTDTPDKGTSKSKAWIADSKIFFAYQLQNGFAYPYAGMGIELGKRDPSSKIVSFLDLNDYDSLRIRVRSSRSEDIKLQIVTNDPTLSRPQVPMSERFLILTTTVERGWSEKSLWLGDFSIPDWWFVANKLKPDPGKRYLDRTAHFNLQSGASLKTGISDTVEVAEISFVGENRALGFILAGIALLLLASFGFLTWLERERMQSVRKVQIATRREDLMNKAEKLPLSSHSTEDTQRILEYIGKHYADPELDLDRVCKETSVNRNRLSALLKEEVGTTFKGHLTDLRLSEANRALTETDLQVTEIAFKVGFGNVSHFNRVFKEHFEITPVEFRRNTKKKG